MELLEQLKNEQFDFMRAEPEFQALTKRLKKSRKVEIALLMP